MLNSKNQGVTSGTSGRRSAVLSAAIFAALAMATSSIALADPELDALKKQVQDLQQKIDAMAKQQAAAPAATAAAPAAAAPAAPSDGSLTMYGITLYGILDVGLQYQTWGAPLSDYFPNGTESLLQKNSSRAIFTGNDSNMSQSQIGIRGSKDLVAGWSAIFNLQSFINPLSGNFSDGLKSLTLNNGKTAANQATGVDTSVAGQLFAGAAYAGFTNKQFGTITFGRQNGLLADGVAKYDPFSASQAFSVIGFSGAAAGGGNTEDRRLDDSLKYVGQFGVLHVGAQYQFNGSTGTAGNAWELVVGGAYANASFDAFYVKKEQAVGATALSAAQVTTLNCPYTVAVGAAAPCNVVGGGGNAMDKALSASISDTTTWSLMGTYNFGAPKLFAGYEHIQFVNPDTPVAPGTTTIGGYVLAYVNNAAFPSAKILQVSWIGGKYTFGTDFDLIAAYYRYDQNAYGTSAATAGCNNTSSGLCKGRLNAYSLAGDYRLSKRFDVYGGFMWSGVQAGLANGYLHTNTIDPTVGIRFTF
jgi:predicted porin